jgi:hypothetical protein
VTWLLEPELQNVLRVVAEHFRAVFSAEQNTPICAHLLTPTMIGHAGAPLETGQTHRTSDERRQHTCEPRKEFVWYGDAFVSRQLHVV